jgi:hypothetical protein
MITTRPYLATARGERPNLPTLESPRDGAEIQASGNRFGLLASIHRHRYVTKLMSLYLVRGQ